MTDGLRSATGAGAGAGITTVAVANTVPVSVGWTIPSGLTLGVRANGLGGLADAAGASAATAAGTATAGTTASTGDTAAAGAGLTLGVRANGFCDNVRDGAAEAGGDRGAGAEDEAGKVTALAPLAGDAGGILVTRANGLGLAAAEATRAAATVETSERAGTDAGSLLAAEETPVAGVIDAALAKGLTLGAGDTGGTVPGPLAGAAAMGVGAGAAVSPAGAIDGVLAKGLSLALGGSSRGRAGAAAEATGKGSDAPVLDPRDGTRANGLVAAGSGTAAGGATLPASTGSGADTAGALGVMEPARANGLARLMTDG